MLSPDILSFQQRLESRNRRKGLLVGHEPKPGSAAEGAWIPACAGMTSSRRGPRSKSQRGLFAAVKYICGSLSVLLQLAGEFFSVYDMCMETTYEAGLSLVHGLRDPVQRIYTNPIAGVLCRNSRVKASYVETI